MKALAAMSLNRVIGNKGGIPWKCSADMKWFKEFTLGQNLIMGRTTFETLPYLRDRRLWVLSSHPLSSPVLGRYEPWELTVTNDIDTLPRNGIVVGGAKVYQSLLPHCDELYLTIIKQEVEGDTMMPPFHYLYSEQTVLHDDAERTLLKITR